MADEGLVNSFVDSTGAKWEIVLTAGVAIALKKQGIIDLGKFAADQSSMQALLTDFEKCIDIAWAGLRPANTGITVEEFASRIEASTLEDLCLAVVAAVVDFTQGPTKQLGKTFVETIRRANAITAEKMAEQVPVIETKMRNEVGKRLAAAMDSISSN